MQAHSPKLSLAAIVLVAVAALVPYLNSTRGEFTFDDLWVIADNPLVQAGDPLAVLTEVYQPGPHYRPVALLTFLFNEWIGLHTFGYHLVNIFLHVAVSVLVYNLAAHLLHSGLAALLAAILFAVHPVHTEAVASIVGRFELLAALSVLGALAAFVRSLEGPKHRRLWLCVSVACFALGPFAKENALTAIPMIALTHYWLDRSANLRQRILVLLPYLAAAAIYLALRVAFTGALVLPAKYEIMDNTLAHVSPGVRILTSIVILFDYLSLLLAPIVLSADYSYNQIPPVTSIFDPRLLTAAATFGALGLGLFAARHRAPALLFAFALCGIALCLTSNLPFAIGTMKGERLLYLPSFGWCLAVGWLAARALTLRPRVWAPLLSILVLLYGARTWARNYDWQNNTALFEATVHSSPGSAKAHFNLGVAYMQNEKLDDAMIQFRRSLQIFPGYAEAAFAIGKIYEMRGIEAGALTWYTKSIQIDWRCYKAHLHLGRARYQRGEYAAAEAAFRSGLAIEPEHPRLLLSLGAARLSQGAPWEAHSLMRTYDDLAWVHPTERAEVEGFHNALTEALNQ